MHKPNSNCPARASNRVDGGRVAVSDRSLKGVSAAVHAEPLETPASQASAPDEPSSYLSKSPLLDEYDEDRGSAQPEYGAMCPTIARERKPQHKTESHVQTPQPKRIGPLPQTLAERTSTGTKFTLSNLALLSSSIQENGERISADVVHRAFRHIASQYDPRGWLWACTHGSRQQHLVMRLCEVLAYHDLIDPNVEDYEFMDEVLNAVKTIKLALNC